jgi:hypothetical protein
MYSILHLDKRGSVVVVFSAVSKERAKGQRHDMFRDTNSDPSLFVWSETQEKAHLCLQHLVVHTSSGS